MKSLTTWLNEAEYKLFKHRAEKRNMTPYALQKRLMTDFLEANSDKDLIIVKDKKTLLIAYLMTLYGLVVTTILLVF